MRFLLILLMASAMTMTILACARPTPTPTPTPVAADALYKYYVEEEMNNPTRLQGRIDRGEIRRFTITITAIEDDKVQLHWKMRRSHGGVPAGVGIGAAPSHPQVKTGGVGDPAQRPGRHR